MYGPLDHPALTAAHLADARLFANRHDLVSALALSAGGVVAELGVAHGEFSAHLIAALKPARFLAFDYFHMHEMDLAWGVPTSELLEGMTHPDFYRRRFSRSACSVELIQGDTAVTFPLQPDASFDLIYIDAGHRYAEVTRDTQTAARKVKPGGVLVFNDYVMTDHLREEPYGVVQAVNELVVGTDWKVVGLALQHQMFCDIALSRCLGPVWR